MLCKEKSKTLLITLLELRSKFNIREISLSMKLKIKRKSLTSREKKVLEKVGFIKILTSN